VGEVLPSLLGILVCLGVIGLIIVLPIIALVRGRRVEELSRRLDELEDEVRRLRRQVRGQAGPETPATEPEPAEAVTEATPPESAPAGPPRRRSWPTIRPPDAVSLEQWIGRRGLGWAAVVLLLFATAFFLQMATSVRPPP
jgi:hypothetical protein